MPSIELSDITRMREQLLFEGAARGRKLSAFWVLLVLAALIASAGIVADSTATVIGAMIVAPLMTPILGIVLSVAIGDGRNLAVSIALVATGALAVVVVGYLIGLVNPIPVDATTSSQVAGRVQPHLIDLVAAVATGAVGAFALVRRDVSDTLPGVAIAISLVPPLAVVGLTLEAGTGSESVGALLLFLTNVGAILITGLIVMAVYRVRPVALLVATRPPLGQRAAVAVVVVFVIAISAPLAGSTVRIVKQRQDSASIDQVAKQWAGSKGWDVVKVEYTNGHYVIRALGQLPAPAPRDLRKRLNAARLGDVDVELQLVPEARIELPAAQ
jgi:uncharacterized hydrophobic protein (TIGR00271 family)